MVVEKKREDEKLKADEGKRVGAVKGHRREAEETLQEYTLRAGQSPEERDATARKERALDEARRRIAKGDYPPLLVGCVALGASNEST